MSGGGDGKAYRHQYHVRSLGSISMPGRAPKPTLLAVAIFLTSVGVAGAVPIPENPMDSAAEQFTGSPATPRPVKAKLPPRHPFMAPNGRSNLHNDAYQTDTYRRAGPLGPQHAAQLDLPGAATAPRSPSTRGAAS